MKRLTLGLMALVGLMFTSCHMETKDSTQKVSYITYNLITPLDGGDPVATASIYQFNFNLTKGIASIETTLVYNSAQYSFSTDEVPFYQYPPYNGMVYYLKGFSGNVNNQVTMPLENTQMLITSDFNYPYDSKYNVAQWYPNKEGAAVSGNAIDGVLYTPSNQWISPILVGSYQIGQDFRVKTFTCDSFYTGTTTTTYPGMDGNMSSNTSNSIYYRVVLDVAKKKAYVVMYKAKFSASPQEPEKSVVYLKDLDITWGDGYYIVEGSDIVPETIDGGKMEPNESFKFKSFKMTTAGQYLTDASMNYEVINSMHGQQISYNGFFQGNMATIPSNLGQTPQ